MKIQLIITEELIAKAKRESAESPHQHCPVAQAATAQFNCTGAISAKTRILDIGNQEFAYSPELYDEVYNYDLYQTFKPGVYELTLL